MSSQTGISVDTDCVGVSVTRIYASAHFELCLGGAKIVLPGNEFGSDTLHLDVELCRRIVTAWDAEWKQMIEATKDTPMLAVKEQNDA